VKHLILLFSICILCSVGCAQELQCPHLPRWVKHRLEKQARWLVNKSLQKHIAKKSQVFGNLVEYYQQCSSVEAGSLRDPAMEGTYFTLYLVDAGVPLQSMFGRYRGIWTMAVVPWDGNAKLPYAKMPEANLLEITENAWTLIDRDKDGSRTVLARENY
jgi:hypothetical protein